MSTHSLTALQPNGSFGLNLALDDPRVQQLARAMQLDLQNPATLSRLLAFSQQCVQDSENLDLGQKQMMTQLLMQSQNGYASFAVRAYREMAALQ